MMKTTWNRSTKYLVGIGLVLVGIYILYLSRSVIPLLSLAALIALIVRPVISRLQDRVHLSRGLAVGLVYLCLVILIPLVFMLILPALIDTVTYLANLDYQSILTGGEEWLRSTLIAIKAVRLPVASFDAYVDRVVDTLLEASQPPSSSAAVSPSFNAILQSLSSTLKSMMTAGANLVGGVFSQVAKIIFVFLASIYISLDAHTYRESLLRAIPASYQSEISILLTRIEKMWDAFLHGELILMVVIGVMTTIGLTALGVPGALYLGIIAGLLEIIPNLGPIIATIPAVIVALIQGSAYLPISNLAFVGVIILFYILVQQVENNLIVPRVLGTAVDLPPLIVMTGVVVGASVGGILGALLATPVIATGREILSYAYRKLLDEEPFPVDDPFPKAETSPSRFRNWLSSLLAKLRRHTDFPLHPTRQDGGKASAPQGGTGDKETS